MADSGAVWSAERRGLLTLGTSPPPPPPTDPHIVTDHNGLPVTDHNGLPVRDTTDAPP